MDLFLHELAHFSVGLAIGYFVWKKYDHLFISFIAAFLGAFLIDLDHLIDYFLTFGLSFNLEYFLNSYQFEVSQKTIVAFHGWEYVIILSLVYLYLEKVLKKSKSKIKSLILPFILAFTLGMYSHLIIDSLTNDVSMPAYSIIYRMLNNFDTKAID